MRLNLPKSAVWTLAIAGLFGSATPAAASASALNRANTSQHVTAVPTALRPALYQALAKDTGPAYRIGKDGCAELPKQKLEACFDANGAHFGGAGALSLKLTAWGRGDDLAVIKPVNPIINDNKVSYPHDNITEWWRVLPIGFEQGFTIAKRPAGHGELALTLTTSRTAGDAPTIRHSCEGGTAKAECQSEHARSAWPGGRATYVASNPVSNTLAWDKLHYGKLVVTDANGKDIPATLKSQGNHILITANDTRAVYPLTIDPLVWVEQKVTSGDPAARENFGFSVTLDGTTALVGAKFAIINHNIDQGAVYVFTQIDDAWAQTQKLIASDGIRDSHFGQAVALDGRTALIGASGGTSNQGTAYVFTESNGTWTQTQKLSANDGTAGDAFGWSVAFDGKTVLIGAPGNQSEGAAYVFTKSGNSWEQTTKLTASDGATNDAFGAAVALDGMTVLIGAPGNQSEGAAYVFTKSGDSWGQTAKLTASDGEEGSGFGGAVALDGATALVGAPFSIVNGNIGPGAAYVFVESGGQWTQTQKLTTSDHAAGDWFGGSIALSGTTALIGADFAGSLNPHQGAAYIFTKSNGTWTQTVKLVASGGTTSYGFGISTALFGKTALIGAAPQRISPAYHGAAYFENLANLSLAISAPAHVDPGSNYVSQAIVTNKAGATSPAISVTMAIPAAASFVSATATQGTCSQTPAIVTCHLGAINGNAGTARANVKLKASTKNGTRIKNTMSVALATPALTAIANTTAGNNAPVAEDGTLTTDEDTPASGTLVATDPDGDPLTFSLVNDPAHGSVTLDDASTGAYTYTPDSGFSGSDSFTFKASDGVADSNIATISVTVNAAPPPPPPPPPSDGGGGATAPLGLLAFAFIGLLALFRRRR